MPTVEETFHEISAKVLAKLDLNMAFLQIEMHPDLRAVIIKDEDCNKNDIVQVKRFVEDSTTADVVVDAAGVKPAEPADHSTDQDTKEEHLKHSTRIKKPPGWITEYVNK